MTRGRQRLHAGLSSAAAVTVALGLSFPGAASADVTVGAVGGSVTVTGDEERQSVTVDLLGNQNGTGTLEFSVRGLASATVSPPCVFVANPTIGHRCQFTGTPREVHASLGGSDDLFTKSALGAPWDLFLDLGDGPDVLQIEKQGAQDTLEGGAGRDLVDYSGCQSCTTGGLTVDLSSATDQLSGFEDVGGAAGPNTLTGDGGVNFLSGGSQADTIAGLGGGDLLYGNDGNDALDGGGGVDFLSAGDGDDTVTAADGVTDSLIRCGPGDDLAIVDALDPVIQPPDPDGCETIQIGAGPPVIAAGPSGTVGSASAQFEFAMLGAPPPPGRFECALDGGAFTPCTSPLTLSGLAQGAHVFQVRYHPDGESPGSPAQRQWTVDGVPPVVTFGSAPSGGGQPPDATISFNVNEPASLACSLDGGAVFDCVSPQELHGLAVGLHSFAVEATDAAGNVSAQIRTEWEVVAPAPVPPAAMVTCDPGKQNRVAFGVIVAVARSPAGCFGAESVDGRQALVSHGAVSVNGIRLIPEGATRIIVDPGLVGGVVRATGPVTLSPGDLQLGWRLDEGFTLDGLAQGGVTLLNKLLPFNQALLRLAGMPVTGSASLDLSTLNGGQTRFTVRVSLPRATFQSLPGLSPAGQGLTVEVPLTVSNDRGLTGGVRLKLSEANLFGRIKVKDLDLFYDHTTEVFEGSAAIKLADSAPVGRAEPTFTVGVALGPNGLIGPLRKLSFQSSSLNRYVGYGVFLQRFGGALERAADAAGNVLARFTAAAGVSLGPRVRIGSFETEALSLDGSLILDVPTGPSPPEPFSVTQAGALKVVDIPFAGSRVRYVPPARVEVAATVDYTLFGYGIVGQLAADAEGRPLSWVSPDGFNLEVRGQASFPALGGSDPANAVFSTSGWAVCVGGSGERIGFGRRWGGPLNSMADACDVGPYRAVAAVAQHAGARATEIAPGARLAVLSARGGSTPPKVTVEGPGGVRIQTPDGPAGVRTGAGLLVQDARANTTYVVLRRPPAGRWTVTPQPGSPAFTSLRVADALPAVTVTARVRGNGRRRSLAWRSGPLAFGQKLTFVERSGQAARVLTTTTRTRGRLDFTPDTALGPARKIEVTVAHRGIPRLTRTVARYTVPRPMLRPVSGLRLRGRTLTWSPQPAAASYALAVTLPGGATTSHSTRRPRLTLKSPPPGNLKVAIVALDTQGRVGRPVSASLRPSARR